MRLISIMVAGLAACGGGGGSTPGPDAPPPPPPTPDAPTGPSPSAFRVSSLALRDPHVFVNLGGCKDITDVPVLGLSLNGSLQKAITTDSNNDGLLDFSALVVFRPLDQAAASGPAELRMADCTAPMSSTSCKAKPSAAVIASTAANTATGECLGPIAGTTYDPYTPEVSTASGPCFTTDLMTLTLDLGMLPIMLRDAEIAATYAGNPADSLTSGLIRGFLSETDANAIIVPSPINAPLSSLLPGGTNSCATHDDRDTDNGTVGWYFYLDVAAARVPYSD